MRAVLDPNVLISALLSPEGSPAKVLRAWLAGSYELVVSPLLLAELERAPGYPKLRSRITAAETQELVALLSAGAALRDDPGDAPPVRSPDPGDDYLIASAVSCQAVIVTGDRHLLGLGDDHPVYPPSAFLAIIEARDR